MQLKTKLTITLIIILVLNLAWPIFFVYTYGSNKISDLTNEYAKQSTKTINTNIKNLLEYEEANNRNNALNPSLVAAMSQKNIPAQELHNIVATYKIEDFHSNISITNPEGNIISSTNPFLIGERVNINDPYFKQATNGKDGFDFKSETSKLSFTSAIGCTNGKVCGILITELEPEVITDILEVQNKNYSTIINSKLVDNQYQINSIAPINPHLPISSNIISTSIQDPKTKKTYEIENLQKYGILLVTEIDNSTIKEEETEFILILLFTSFASLITMGLLGYALLDKYTSPLSELQLFSKSLAIKDDKDLELVKIKTKDEFESVGNSINRLIIKLNNYQSSAKSLLDQKTKDLEQINKKLIGRETKMIELKQKIQKLQNDKNTKKKN